MIQYDPEVDVLSLLFRTSPVAKSKKGKPGVIKAYDKEGNLVGLEITEASRRIENPAPWSVPTGLDLLLGYFRVKSDTNHARG